MACVMAGSAMPMSWKTSANLGTTRVSMRTMDTRDVTVRMTG